MAVALGAAGPGSGHTLLSSGLCDDVCWASVTWKYETATEEERVLLTVSKKCQWPALCSIVTVTILTFKVWALWVMSTVSGREAHNTWNQRDTLSTVRSHVAGLMPPRVSLSSRLRNGKGSPCLEPKGAFTSELRPSENSRCSPCTSACPGAGASQAGQCPRASAQGGIHPWDPPLGSTLQGDLVCRSPLLRSFALCSMGGAPRCWKYLLSGLEVQYKQEKVSKWPWGACECCRPHVERRMFRGSVEGWNPIVWSWPAFHTHFKTITTDQNHINNVHLVIFLKANSIKPN